MSQPLQATIQSKAKTVIHWLGFDKSESIAGYLFSAPSAILILIFVVVPMVAGMVLGFYQWDAFGKPVSNGLNNFRQLWTDPVFLAALKNTFYFACVSTPISIVLGLCLAIAINEPWVKGKGFFTTVHFIPVIMSMVAVALIWRWIYDNEYGLLNSVLQMLGLPKQLWLQNPRWVIPALMLVDIWKTVGYIMVIYLAALQDVPRHLVESAELDGAGWIQKNRHIVIPWLAPATLFVTVVSFINSFQVFDLVYIFMGERGPDKNSIVMVFDIYLTAFRSYQLGYASAQAFVLFLIILAFSVGLLKVLAGDKV